MLDEEEEIKENDTENILVIPDYKRDGKCFNKLKKVSMFPLEFGVFIKDSNSFVSKISICGTIFLVVVLMTAAGYYFVKISEV